MNNKFAENFFKLRKDRRLTQEQLATMLGVSFQAVSKWENSQSYPDIETLSLIAAVFETNIDSLLGYIPQKIKIDEYENKYKSKEYYWGVVPSNMCYEVMKLMPPTRPLRLLDIGCGEGKDAVFFAQNGYTVSAFDLSPVGIEKAKALAYSRNVDVNFFVADMSDYEIDNEFDIIYSNGLLHYLGKNLRNSFYSNLKRNTATNGINALSTFVVKPFIPIAPDKHYQNEPYLSGELFTYYSDWMLMKCDEVIFDCNIPNVPHKHCMDIMIAKKYN